MEVKSYGKFPDPPNKVWDEWDLSKVGVVEATPQTAAVQGLSAEPTMSSREIADLTGKEHRNVLRDCDNLNESYSKLGLLKIEQGYYLHQNTGNQQHKEYRLTKMQTFDLMTGYSQELRIKVNRRWAELEEKERQQFAIPKTFSEALMLAAKQQEQIEL